MKALPRWCWEVFIRTSSGPKMWKMHCNDRWQRQIRKWRCTSARWRQRCCFWRKLLKIKGPDNPTRQLLWIKSTKCCSGDGEGRKDKGGGGGPRSKTKLCVTKLYVKAGVWLRKIVCVTKWCVQDGVCESCVWKRACDKVVWERRCATKWCVKDGVVKDGVWQSGVWKMVWWKMVRDKVLCERWCVKDGVKRWSVTVLKDGVWQRGVWKMVCERWCVTKWCVTKRCVKDGMWQSGVWKMVCDNVMCERWCVTMWCVTKWCVTKRCVKDGMWQSGVWKMVCDNVMCERWCVTMWCVTKWCVTKRCVKDGVWQSGVWKMVCDKVGVWQSCVWKMACDKVGVWEMVLERWSVTVCERWSAPRLPRKTTVDVRLCHACHVKRRWMSDCATPATQSGAAPRRQIRAQARHPVPSVPRLPRKTTVDARLCHACHVKRRWMSDCATPATQSGAAPQAPNPGPSAPPMWVCATPATWNEGGCQIVPRLPRKVARRPRRQIRAQARHPVP